MGGHPEDVEHLCEREADDDPDVEQPGELHNDRLAPLARGLEEPAEAELVDDKCDEEDQQDRARRKENLRPRGRLEVGHEARPIIGAHIVVEANQRVRLKGVPPNQGR